MTSIGFHSDRASVHLGAFSLLRASSAAQLERAGTLRRRVFLERRGVVLDGEQEARRDQGACVLLLFRSSTLVATARVSPYPSPLSPLPTGRCLGAGADSELSRVACTKSGCCAQHSILLLTLGASYLLAHTEFQRYVACAHAKFCAAHRRLGAIDTGERCAVPHHDEPYHILSGSYADARRNGSALLGTGRAALPRSA